MVLGDRKPYWPLRMSASRIAGASIDTQLWLWYIALVIGGDDSMLVFGEERRCARWKEVMWVSE